MAMKNYLSGSMVVVVLLIAVLVTLPSCGLLNDEEQEAEENGNGEEAPAFEREELFTGETKQFPGAWEGKVVYLNFFTMG